MKIIISLVLIIIIFSSIILIFGFGTNDSRLDTSIKKENVDLWTQKKKYKNSVSKIKKE